MSTMNDENQIASDEIDTGTVFDTRSATKKKVIYLILDDGTPEGNKVKFDISPLTSDVYMAVVAKQREIEKVQQAMESGKSDTNKTRLLMDMTKTVDDMLMPIITPRKPFEDWVHDTLNKGAYMAYRNVMNTVIKLAFDDVKQSGE